MNANINLDGFQPREGDNEKVILAKAKAIKHLMQGDDDMSLLDQLLDYGPFGLGFILLCGGLGIAAIIAALSGSTIAKYLGC